MKSIALAALATSTLAAAVARAEDPTPQALEAARQVAVTTCATCHGPGGHSTNPKFPQLGGQHATYVAAQLRGFKAQSRGDADAMAYMWGMSAPLNDELIDALAAWYARQPASSAGPADPTLASRGKSIYQEGVPAEGIPACATCHGPAAAGTDDFPRLAGQSGQYLLKQLRSFQNNMRNMAVMHGVAAGLKEQEMRAVATYLQSLGG